MAELKFGPKACQNLPHHHLLHGRTETRTHVHMLIMISELCGLHQAVFSTAWCFCDIYVFVDNDALTVSSFFTASVMTRLEKNKRLRMPDAY